METSVASPVLGGGIQNILPRMPLRFTFFDPSVTNLDRFMCYLGLIYFFAFGGYYLQFPGLYGSKGLVPLEDYYSQFPKSSSFSQVPNLMIFLITPGSKKAKALTVFGEKFYVGDVAEVFSLLGCFLSLVLYLFYVVRINIYVVRFFTVPTCWLLYLSLYIASDVFLHFQWDILLLEFGFLSNFYLLSTDPRFHACVDFLFRSLFVKLLYMTGYVKQTAGCDTWKHLTALEIHYVSQCIPTEISWFAHQAPPFLNRLGVAVMFAMQLPPGVLLVFAPWRPIRLFAAAMQLFLQVMIFLTGNYNWFNICSVVLLWPCVGTGDCFWWGEGRERAVEDRKREADNAAVAGDGRAGAPPPEPPAAPDTSDWSSSKKPIRRPLSFRLAMIFIFYPLVFVLGIGFLVHLDNDIVLVEGSGADISTIVNNIVNGQIFPWLYDLLAVFTSAASARDGISAAFTRLVNTDFLAVHTTLTSSEIENYMHWYTNYGLNLVQIFFGLVAAQYLVGVVRDWLGRRALMRFVGPRGGGDEPDDQSPEPDTSRNTRSFPMKLILCFTHFSLSTTRVLLVGLALAVGFIPWAHVYRGGIQFWFKHEAAEFARMSQVFHTSNAYGLFRRMTGVGPPYTKRGWAGLDYIPVPEVPALILEGRDADTEKWREIHFKYAPGPVNRIPPRVAPYQPRLDWQMWFAALTPGYQGQHWLLHLTYKILLNNRDSEDVLELIDGWVVDSKPTTLDDDLRPDEQHPKATSSDAGLSFSVKDLSVDQIRIKQYHYDFTRYDFKWHAPPSVHGILGKKGVQQKNWWKRKFHKEWLEPISIETLQQVVDKMDWIRRRSPRNALLVKLRNGLVRRARKWMARNVPNLDPNLGWLLFPPLVLGLVM